MTRTFVLVVTRKYLRVRGEEHAAHDLVAGFAEIPPRARRRGLLVAHEVAEVGNTSACAEKRFEPHVRTNMARKYLRVRGEEIGTYITADKPLEIPPRARRRVSCPHHVITSIGNTSACAEKSSGMRFLWLWLGKYLRVRGEEQAVPRPLLHVMEIPPRARRRESSFVTMRGWVGNTSACAEKSYEPAFRSLRLRKYLRVRGEERLPAASARPE